MTIKCRSCKLAQDIYPSYYTVSCEKISINFNCLMCDSKNNVRYHPPDDFFAGITFECDECHNYIQYYNDNESPLYKEEFYIEDLLIINDRDHDCTFVSNCTKYMSPVEIPFIEFVNKSSFLKRIKNVLVFA